MEVSINEPEITVFGKREAKVIEEAIFLPDKDDLVLIVQTFHGSICVPLPPTGSTRCIDLFAPGKDAYQMIADKVGLSMDRAKIIGHGGNDGISVR